MQLNTYPSDWRTSMSGVMLFLSSAVLLSAILMTQAKDISEDLNQEPLSELLYLFDVTSDAPVSDLKGALTKLKTRHSFQVMGENRYFFVVLSDNVENLRDLRFPAGSVVTQSPLQHAADFFRMFGVTSGYEVDDREDMLKNNTLRMNIRDFIFPENTPTEVYKEQMAAFADEYKNTLRILQTVCYAVVASYPARMFFFGTVDDNALQYFIKDGLDAVDGPAATILLYKTVVKI